MAQAEKVQQFYFISHRDVNVGSLSGRSIQFDKGVPTHVPREMHTEVMEKGILPCDQDGKILDDIQGIEKILPTAGVVLAPEDPAERKAAITAAMHALVKRNARADFTGGGIPHEVALTAALGWRVEQREVRAIWAEIKPEVMKASGGGK